jgi:hypothetical protein
VKNGLDDTDLLADPRFNHGLNYDLSPSTDHKMTWDLILQWFSTCKKSHGECNAPGVNGSFKPRRILKVDRTGENVLFQLVDGTECAAKSAYMTLSYCWGSQPAAQVYRLLQSTVQGMRSKQSVNILPETIRDAIKIAGYFQVQYLWVDRLCIFQDSAKDFQREASSMADVYQNAILNIAALGAQDADGGCFFERDSRFVAPTQVNIQHDRYDRPMPYRFISETKLGWRPSFVPEPLVHRAWTVQERLLARRVIYFGSKQVFWECKQAHWCETHSIDVNDSDDIEKTMVTKDKRWDHVWERLLHQGSNHPWKNIIDDIIGDGYFREHVFDKGSRLGDPYAQLLADWSGIVTSFSKCALTVPSDKFVALSGLANEMRRRLEELRPGTRHRYVAGLWEEELPGVLSWRVSEAAYRPAAYRAPTWSWASIDGLVSFPRKGLDTTSIFSTLTAVKVEQPPGEAEAGQVENASITLLGPLLSAKVSSTEGGQRPKSATFDIASVCEASDVGFKTYHDSEAMAPVQLGITRSRVDFDTLDDIRQDISQIIIQRNGVHIEGIAVVASDTETCTYRRVGYFRYQFGDPLNDRREGSLAAQQFAEKFSKRSIVIV